MNKPIVYDMLDVYESYEESMGHVITLKPNDITTVNRLMNEYSNWELLCYALSNSNKAEVGKLYNYICAIMNNWNNLNLVTKEDVIAYHEECKLQREQQKIQQQNNKARQNQNIKYVNQREQQIKEQQELISNQKIQQSKPKIYNAKYIRKEPTVSWLKDGVQLQPEKKNFELTDKRSILIYDILELNEYGTKMDLETMNTFSDKQLTEILSMKKLMKKNNIKF